MATAAVRVATAEHNQGLIELERLCPQGSRLMMHSERHDYFYRSKLYGNHHTLITVDGDTVYGVLAATLKEVYLQGKVVPAALRKNYLSEEMKQTGLFSCYRLRRGSSFASIGLYRISKQIWTRVIKIPFYYRVLKPVLDSVRPLIPTPRIPRDGDSIYYYHVFNHLAEGPDGLSLWQELIKYANNVALAEGVILLTSAFDPTDRFYPLYRKGALNSIEYEIVCRTLQPGVPASFVPAAVDVRDMD